MLKHIKAIEIQAKVFILSSKYLLFIRIFIHLKSFRNSSTLLQTHTNTLLHISSQKHKRQIVTIKTQTPLLLLLY